MKELIFLMLLMCPPAFAAVDFNPSDEAIDLGSASSLDDQEPFAASVWIYPDSSNAGTFRRIFGKDSTTILNTGYWMLFFHNGGTNRIRFNKSHATGDVLAVTNDNAWTADTWQNFLVTYDGGTSASGIHIYVNGVEQTYSLTQDATGAKASDASISLFLGNRGALTSGFDGQLSEFYFWDKVLSADEIANISKSRVVGIGLQVSPSNLLVYTPLDDFADGATVTGASSIIDRSGNGNHGSPSNDPVARAQQALSYP